MPSENIHQNKDRYKPKKTKCSGCLRLTTSDLFVHETLGKIRLCKNCDTLK